MTHRVWIFKPSILLAIVVGLIAYCFVAEMFDFHLILLRAPDTSALNHRLRECIVLWGVVCSIVGWSLFLLKRRPEKVSVLWPILVFPLGAALFVAVPEGVDVYRSHAQNLNRALPQPRWWADIGVPLMGVVLSFGLGVAVAVPLVLQAKFWRQPITLGVCPVCEYDLTGNESGVCPECGSGIVMDPNIPYYFYRRRFVWIPELAEFPDAKARADACAQAATEWRRSPASFLGLIVAMLTAASVTPYLSPYLGRWQWAIALVLVVLTVATNLFGSRRVTRRSLRQQLTSAKPIQDAQDVPPK